MKITLFTLLSVLLVSMAYAQNWQTVSTDQPGDGANSNLADGTTFEYYQDTVSDSLFFRVEINNMNSTISSQFGVNIMFNVPGGGNTFNFWGSENHDSYNLLLTTWVTGSVPSNYSGTIGLADAYGVSQSLYTNVQMGGISIVVDDIEKLVTLGVDRQAIVPDALMTSNELAVKIAGAVGSNQHWNDDIYSPNLEITVVKPGEAPVDTTGNGDGDGPHDWTVGVMDGSEAQVQIEISGDQISLRGAKFAKSEVIDLKGRSVVAPIHDDSNPTFQINGLSSGIYIVRGITEAGQVYHRKFYKT